MDLRASIDDAFDLVTAIADGSLRDVPVIAAGLHAWVEDHGVPQLDQVKEARSAVDD